MWGAGSGSDHRGDGSTGVAGMAGRPATTTARRHDLEQGGAAPTRRARSRRDVPRQRPGWYAYRVTGPAELPSWAAEIALTIERPTNHEPEPSSGRDAATAGSRPPPRGAGRRGRAASVHSPEPDGDVRLTSSAGGPVEPGPGRVGAEAQSLVLLRAPGRARWLAGVAEAVAEVERAAGLESGDDGSGSRRVGGSERLLMGPALPGLAPVEPVVARAWLEAAGTRGLPAPPRRWRSAAGTARWRPSAGAVVTCEGPRGVSAQAVVALGGLGNALAITPPPGGALVLRAWRARRCWGLACGLVIAADSALGLGREAGRVAARLRADGWPAAVLNGAAALHLARAGSPEEDAPAAAARTASPGQVAALFETRLLAGGIDRPATRSRWVLAVTP